VLANKAVDSCSLDGSRCVSGFSGQVSTSPPPLRSLGYVGWTAADFDGDKSTRLGDHRSNRPEQLHPGLRLSTNFVSESRSQRPDLPVLPSSPFWVTPYTARCGRDHDLDIVFTVGIARQPMAVWINDSQGDS